MPDWFWWFGSKVSNFLFPITDITEMRPMPQANERQVGGDHYRKHGAQLQHWDLVAMFGWDYFQGQIIKYLMRWRDKNGVQDLEKAAHYLQKYIEVEQRVPLGDERSFIKSALIDALRGEQGLPPVHILDAAELIGRYFAELNIKDWKVGPCQARRDAEGETNYAKPGEIAATGWIGYTHEGADANGFHFRCKKCLERFYTAPDDNPHRVHKCKGYIETPPIRESSGDATPAYVQQNGHADANAEGHTA